MNADVRVPIGGMFSIVGVLLTLYGLATWNAEMYSKSLGFNINILWGLAMAVFGGLMFYFGWRVKHLPPKPAEPGSQRRGGH